MARWFVISGAVFAVLMAGWLLTTVTRTPEAGPETWEEFCVESVRSMKAGDMAEAERLCQEAMKLATPTGPTDTRLTRTHMLMGEVHRRAGRNDLAERSYLDAVRSCEETIGRDRFEMIIPLDALANFYAFTLQRDDQVVPLYERTLALTEQAIPRDDLQVAIRARNLAEVYQRCNRPADAEPLYERALTLIEKAGVTDAELASYLLSYAEFYRGWGKHDRAAELAERAVAIRQADTSVDGLLDTATILKSLGQTQLAAGEPAGAEASYRRALAILEAQYGPESPDVAPALVGLAEALAAQGRREPADAESQRALRVTEAGLGADSPEAAAVRATRNRILESRQGS